MIEIRLAQLAEAPLIAQVHIRAWQEAYKGLLPAAYLANLSLTRRTAWWEQILSLPAEALHKVLILQEAGQIIGFAHFGPTDEAFQPAGTAKLYAIYLLAESWGKGHGRALLEQMLDYLAEDDFQTVMLWVLEGNERAIRFYEQAGFVANGTVKVETMGEATVRELRYTRPVKKVASSE